MTSNRLPGHTLRFEGKVYGYNHTVRQGRARCTCGAESLVLDSDAARKRWHREHKDEIREEIRRDSEADDRTPTTKAIRRLRQLVQEATPGRWEVGEDETGIGPEFPIFMHDAGCDMALFENEADARYAAAMRPAVGAALADFLDEVALTGVIHRKRPSEAFMALVRAIEEASDG